jgi:hypothetical protein
MVVFAVAMAAAIQDSVDPDGADPALIGLALAYSLKVGTRGGPPSLKIVRFPTVPSIDSRTKKN